MYPGVSKNNTLLIRQLDPGEQEEKERYNGIYLYTKDGELHLRHIISTFDNPKKVKLTSTNSFYDIDTETVENLKIIGELYAVL